MDIAIRYGFSSQEALTRVFKEQYGCTPAAYRRENKPVPMIIHKHVLFPQYDEKRAKTMEETRLAVRVEHIPAHKYLGIWEEKADNYGTFWDYHDCDEVCGFVTSMDKMAHPIVTAHTAGWKMSGDKKVFFYGTGVPTDYTGEIPKGFEVREIPASDYLVANTLVDVVADEKYDFPNYAYEPFEWKGYTLWLEPFMSRYNTEKQRKRLERIDAFEKYIALKMGDVC